MSAGGQVVGGRITIPWARPTIAEEELTEVREAFAADWLTMGPKVRQFEEAMGTLFEAEHAIAVANGTVALDMVLRVLGVGPGDEVIVPALTYAATAFAVSYQHAVPVFVDVEEESWNLDPAQIEAAVTSRTKAILFIDYGGNPADFTGIASVARHYDLPMVQDGAQSLGARYMDRPAGALADLATTSFHMAKVMTTVEGGMVFVRDGVIAEELRARRNQGERPGEKYLHAYVGMNARMTDMQAGVGLAQLGKLEWMLHERRRIAERYDEALEEALVDRATVTATRGGCTRSCFFYPILIAGRDAIAYRLRADHGIDTRVCYPMPLYSQEVYRSERAASRYLPCPVTERITSQVLNLPIFPGMTDEQVDRVVDALQREVRQ